MCKNKVRNVIEYAQIHQILTDNKYSAPTFFANIRCLFTLSFCAPSVRSHKSNGRAFFVYTSMAAAQRSAAHLMQQLFDSACHVYCKCVSTYKPCLGNNMCEFSCCNCSPFLFFSVSTQTLFSFSLSVSPITLKSAIYFSN